MRSSLWIHVAGRISDKTPTNIRLKANAISVVPLDRAEAQRPHDMCNKRANVLNLRSPLIVSLIPPSLSFVDSIVGRQVDVPQGEKAHIHPIPR